MSTLYAINGNIINAQEPLPIPVDILTLLWENPNPGAAFSAQDITLASDDYDFLLLICRFSTTYDRELSFIVEKGKNEFINAGSTGSGGAIGIWRDFNRVNDTKYSVSNAYYAMGATAQTNNDTNLIPQRIYGFKKQVPMQSGGGGTKYDPDTDMIYLWDGTQWVEWRKANLDHTYLFTDGNFYNGATGIAGYASIWSGNTQQRLAPAVSTAGGMITVTGQGASNQSGTAFLEGTIDITNYSKIKAKIISYVGDYNRILVANSKNDNYTMLANTGFISNVGDVEFDISSLTGIANIGIYIDRSYNMVIESIELVP